jgi:hypothetical protein
VSSLCSVDLHADSSVELKAGHVEILFQAVYLGLGNRIPDDIVHEVTETEHRLAALSQQPELSVGEGLQLG